MSFLTKSQFKSLLSQIRATGARLDALVFQASAYCAEQSCAHGNHAPWTELLDHAPVYAHKPIKAAQKAAQATWKRMSPAERLEYHTQAEPIAAAVAAALEAKRAGQAAKREERKAKTAAPAAPAAPASRQKVKPKTAPAFAKLVSADGFEQELSAEEYSAMAQLLIDMRTKGKVKAA